MVKSCLVATCKNTLGKPGITFHKIGKKRYATRLKAIGRSVEERLSPQNVVCSKHYAQDDFIFFNGKKYLRLEALPRFFIPRRPVVEHKVELVTTSASQPTDLLTSSMNLQMVIANDVWLLCKDFFLVTTPPEDNIDIMINQVNLGQYPTNDFLSSLMSETCDHFDIETHLET